MLLKSDSYGLVHNDEGRGRGRMKNQPFIPLSPALSRPGRGGFRKRSTDYAKGEATAEPLIYGLSFGMNFTGGAILLT
jgi:hypothetical protein